MTGKPQPIAEVTVSYLKYVLNIEVSSNDAREWVRDHAGEFGRLLELESSAFQLVTSDLYSPDDVAAYIRTMGASDTDDDLSAFNAAAAPDSADGAQEE